jgi:hypothetical protein
MGIEVLALQEALHNDPVRLIGLGQQAFDPVKHR